MEGDSSTFLHTVSPHPYKQQQAEEKHHPTTKGSVFLDICTTSLAQVIIIEQFNLVNVQLSPKFLSLVEPACSIQLGTNA